jgi:hypothetical protein
VEAFAVLAPLALVFAFVVGGVPKGCPLLQEREYKVPPINGPKNISKDPRG